MPEESVRPLERGLAVLRSLAAPGHSQQMRASDLVHATGLARSTVDRIVATLAHLGYIRQQGAELHLTPQLMKLGNAYLAAAAPAREITQQVAALADELDESVSLAALDGDAVRFIAQSPRRRAMSVAFQVGDLLPAERCAAGAVFAAAWDDEQWSVWRRSAASDPHGTAFPRLRPRPVTEEDFARRAEQARTRGWALDDQLVEPGLVAIAVPVAGDGRTRYALSLVSHVSRHSAQELADIALPRLQRESEVLAGLFRRDATRPAAGREHTVPWPAHAVGEAKNELGSGFLQSLARGLAVLEALEAASGDGLPVSAVAQITGLPRTTVRRCLVALEQEGYAEHSDGLYRLLPRVLELGHSRIAAMPFGDLLTPHLRALVDRVQESASVTVLDDTSILYVARVPTVRIMTVHIALGTRFPAYATAMGRVLLSGLPDAELERIIAASQPRAFTEHTVTSLARLRALIAAAAEQGHAAIDEELEEGLRSVAVPIKDTDGNVIAALNVAEHSGSTPLQESSDRLLPALRDTARAIENDLHTVTRFSALRIP
ncbi:IclR family transcriptional regulator C-terminal domain-containing protein [Streptomyces sp. NPDC047082]|uniref:IclR family transcriptional regulator domain-containing protein n=1 Tax=Streptomyces sp. NPDC047082 TaxID=3155259 RepID=UPI0033CD9140